MKQHPHRNQTAPLTVITTHINADFDAMASMLAAQKLYPDAVVVFPGSQEKNLRNFFIQSMVYLFNMADIKDIDFNRVAKLVLVDTRQPNRIGKFADLVKREGLTIHIYDHHPQMAQDIKGQYEVIRPTGSTVTILADIINQKKIDITAEEATIMCLGIYEDTGSFTFSSTTTQDFHAAALLLAKGANLNVVSDLIAREISPLQISLLNDMIHAASRYSVNGVQIVITSVTTDSYVPDFAFLVHKMVKMENINAIFAMARMGSKIYIVARSRISEVDVGQILTPMGGGGHNFAAAGTIKGQTLAQAEQKLTEILYQTVKSRSLAKDLMSSPPIMVDENVDCRQAARVLTRYNINALLVTRRVADTPQLSGFITRQVIEKALYHKLDQVAVKEYMTTESASVSPDADLGEIQEKIIENKQRILPVISPQGILGVVTRTDLLNVLARRSGLSQPDQNGRPNETRHARTRKILRFMQERLPARLLAMLSDIGEVADELGHGAYVVGGFVRDLFLYRRNEDVDIVIEGDGIAFAKKYARKVGARIHTYAKFGTAVIIFEDGFKIDVASARMEYYKFPASLPIVEMSSIKLDLFRRDFTINTLAIQLNPKHFGMLIDFFAAQKDLKEKVIRVLHNLSFVEDPTRAFRAIRFEQRFGFSIGKLTAGLIENAVRMDFFKRLSGRRFFSEFKQILEEENPTPALIRMHEYGLLQTIHPSMALTPELVALFDSVKKVIAWYDLLFLEESYMKWAVYFAALLRQKQKQTCSEILQRLEMPPRLATVFGKERQMAEKRLSGLERRLPTRNSTLYRHLTGVRTEHLLFMMAATRKKSVKRAISLFINQLRPVTPLITGKELKALGLEPGPLYRDILEAVRKAKLNGRLKTHADEMAFAKKYRN